MKYLLLIALLYLSVPSVSQEFAIENHKQNIAYAGTLSSLHCVINGYPAKNIRLTTNNGLIKKDENAEGDFIFIPKETGPATITIWVITSKRKKKIGTCYYRVYDSPPAKAMVGISTKGNITKERLILMGGIRGTFFPDYCGDAPAQIVSYSAIAFYNDSCLFSLKNTGAQWSDANITKFKSLKPGATIVFNNILCRLPYDQMQKATDIILNITETDDPEVQR